MPRSKRLDQAEQPGLEHGLRVFLHVQVQEVVRHQLEHLSVNMVLHPEAKLDEKNGLIEYGDNILLIIVDRYFQQQNQRPDKEDVRQVSLARKFNEKILINLDVHIAFQKSTLNFRNGLRIVRFLPV